MTNLQIEVISKDLHFKQPAGTSRGVYTRRKSWFLKITSADAPQKIGWGECAPLPLLSCDAIPDYESVLTEFCRDVIQHRGMINYTRWSNYPSMLMGMETALLHWQKETLAFWNTPFSRGEEGISINGLIWMGHYQEMLKRIETKIEEGYRCIKMKIGAIDFEQEYTLLRRIRSHFTSDEMEIRVDANGAFTAANALGYLQRLATLDLHSIEQPIAGGQCKQMAELIANSPLPVALDEELIGCNTLEQKQTLLDAIQPHYIVLKPSLHGGFKGCEEWIREAESRKINWWITSALESNIGLNAIAQWCASLQPVLPQGLGTGLLFTNNIDSPLYIRKNKLWFDAEKKISLNSL